MKNRSCFHWSVPAVALLGAALFLTGCKREAPPAENPEPKQNIIKDYVGTPLEKARDAEEQVDKRHEQLMKELDEGT